MILRLILNSQWLNCALRAGQMPLSTKQQVSESTLADVHSIKPARKKRNW